MAPPIDVVGPRPRLGDVVAPLRSTLHQNSELPRAKTLGS
jgi:hypothetical protein